MAVQLADMRLQGTTRSFTDDMSENGLFMQFRRAGMHTVSLLFLCRTSQCMVV